MKEITGLILILNNPSISENDPFSQEQNLNILKFVLAVTLLNTGRDEVENSPVCF